MFRKVTIIGVGLIGGSLALAIRERKLADEVWGFFRSRTSLNVARRKKIVDKATRDLNQAVAGSDFVILATPVSTIISLARELQGMLPSDTLVTDVGSSKVKIVKSLQKVFPRYVGSHPLAGSEKKGCANAGSDLFPGKITIITPTSESCKSAVRVIQKFWKQLGCKVIIMPPQLHDRILSQISHLPHLAVFALLNAVNDDFLKFATKGFLDTTRIGASEPQLWLEILESNRTNLMKDLNRYISWLYKYQDALCKEDYNRLLNYIHKASQKRRNLK